MPDPAAKTPFSIHESLLKVKENQEKMDGRTRPIEVKMQSIVNKILTCFEAINTIPRCSGQEERICRWLLAWADRNRFKSKMDQSGNIVIQIPPSSGFEAAPVIALQGHVDMVCEKLPGSTHNFDRDPIRMVRDGEWLKGMGTSLGADNGIALALAITLAEDRAQAHPALELLFTTEEENGLVGAKHLAADILRAQHLINLDSEEQGVVIIGCAGGVDTHVAKTLERKPIPSSWKSLVISISGLRGGHSGVDIHRHRANAVKLLARTLLHLQEAGTLVLVDMHGGTRHNALAREAVGTIAIPPSETNAFFRKIVQLEDVFRNEYADLEPDLTLSCEERKPSGPFNGLALTPTHTQRVIGLLTALPHGVVRMWPTGYEGVETSCNLAVVELSGEKLSLVSSQRSALTSRLDEVTAMVHAVAKLAGAEAVDRNAYPPWQPDAGSKLVQSVGDVYFNLFQEVPKIDVIHAGLECAIIGDLYPNMEMISFGPTIENPHSPSERLNIPSVENVWRLLCGLLSSFKD